MDAERPLRYGGPFSQQAAVTTAFGRRPGSGRDVIVCQRRFLSDRPATAPSSEPFVAFGVFASSARNR
jgi:hypothetical protein